MTPFVLLAGVLCGLTVLGLTHPLWRRGGTAHAPAIGLAITLAGFVFGVAAIGYASLGSPDHLGVGPRPAATALAAASLAPPPRSDEATRAHLSARVDQLAERLKARPDDAALLAELAVAMAAANPRSLQGEPAALVARALKIDPLDRKALALAGTIAFDRRDYAGAVRHWERLAQLAPADGRVARQLGANIAQARQLAGMPSAAAAPASR
jgi:cytochrome c-type biogenesis protein CcmH